MQSGSHRRRGRASAAALATLVALGLAGCRDAGPSGGPSKTPATLAQRLDAMTPADQITFMRALEKEKPGDAVVAFHFGNAYYSMAGTFPPEENDRAVAYYDSAVAQYGRAVDIDSTYSKAYVNMGLAYEGAGKRPDARRVLGQAIEVNPDDVLAYCHLGLLEQGYGDYAEAMRLYRRALVIDPNSAQAHYNLGLAFAEKKVFKEALVEWEKVVALDPDGELGRTAAENVRIIRQYIDAKP